MKCDKCQSSKGKLKKFPFIIEETLLRNPYEHKDVYIHKCKGCSLLYIGLGIQAFDDNLSYWALATTEEIQKLQGIRETPGVFTVAKEIIESKSSHIYGDRDGQYYYKQEPAFVLSGMPAW